MGSSTDEEGIAIPYCKMTSNYEVRKKSLFNENGMKIVKKLEEELEIRGSENQ